MAFSFSFSNKEKPRIKAIKKGEGSFYAIRTKCYFPRNKKKDNFVHVCGRICMLMPQTFLFAYNISFISIQEAK